MALITDPDLLTVGQEVVFDTTNKTIQLVETGVLSTDGITLKAVYSYTKDRWRSDSNLVKFSFPFVPITNEQFELIGGWTFADQASINLLRTGGFAVKNSDGTSAEEYACVITLGNIGDFSDLDTVYYQQEIDGPVTDIVLAQEVNQCIKIYGDTNNGNVDYRSYLKLFVREYTKTYDSTDLDAIGVTEMTYQAYRFPLSNDDDIKITHDDTVSDAYGVTIEYFDTPQTKDFGSAGTADFNVVIDGNNRTIEEIYEAVQSLLRKNQNINSSATTADVIGVTADELLRFQGEILITSQGVFVANNQPADTNSIEFYDNSNVLIKYPYVSAGKIIFDIDMYNDTSAKYMMFYDDGNFGTDSAVPVLDNSDVHIAGNVSDGTVVVDGDSTTVEVTFDYDFDYDSDGGFAGTEKNIILVASGLESAQYTLTKFTMQRSTTISVTVDAVEEKNYVA